MKNDRNINLDLIRCIAVLTVICVHFFLHNGYYNVPVLGKKMYIATLMRTAFMVCVPLFLLLTGYLMNKKNLSKKYYYGIIRTLAMYFLSTLFILIYRIFLKNEPISLVYCIKNITSFYQYSWYISMYIGLFMLIPFINLIYNNLRGKKQKLALIVTMCIITALPSITNTFAFPVVPEWWINIYPFTYYFLGAYISEYKDDIKISLKLNFLLIILSVIIFGTYTFIRTQGSNFIYGAWCEWYSFANIITAVLVFIFLLRIKTDKMPCLIRRIITKISSISLGMYLVSWIFDDCFYPILNAKIPEMTDRLPYFFVMIPLVFICSFILSCITDLIYKGINLIIKKCFNKHIKSPAPHS